MCTILANVETKYTIELLSCLGPVNSWRCQYFYFATKQPGWFDNVCASSIKCNLNRPPRMNSTTVHIHCAWLVLMCGYPMPQQRKITFHLTPFMANGTYFFYLFFFLVFGIVSLLCASRFGIDFSLLLFVCIKNARSASIGNANNVTSAHTHYV